MRLAEIVNGRLRAALAVMWLVGAVLAGATAPFAAARIDVISGLVFAVVAAGLVALTWGTLRGRRWALALSVLGSGGQVFGVVGTVWELAFPIDTAKSGQLRALGVDPTFGVAVNLVYSAAASMLFVWMAIRFFRLRNSALRADRETRQ